MNASIRPIVAGIVAVSMASVASENIEVSTYDELKAALAGAMSGDTILLRDGVYRIPPQDFALVIRTAGITVGGAARDASKVILQGGGMHVESPAHIFYVAADDVCLEHLTLRSVRRHLVQVEGSATGSSDGDGADRFVVRDCVFLDAGEQMLKGSSDGRAAADSGVVQRCRFEYTAGVGPRDYIGGIDVHGGGGWSVQDCLFRGIRSPDGPLAEHAIHFWTGASNTVVERNRILNCDRGIGFGLGDRGHRGGIIRNNMIWNDGLGRHEDVGIGLESSPETVVCHNTIWLARYPNAVEWRFAATAGVSVFNNLSNRAMTGRDGATGRVRGNREAAEGAWFRELGRGDLHLKEAVEGVVDAGEVSAEVADDIDGDLRPAGKGWDLGADERR